MATRVFLKRHLDASTPNLTNECPQNSKMSAYSMNEVKNRMYSEETFFPLDLTTSSKMYSDEKKMSKTPMDLRKGTSGYIYTKPEGKSVLIDLTNCEAKIKRTRNR